MGRNFSKGANMRNLKLAHRQIIIENYDFRSLSDIIQELNRELGKIEFAVKKEYKADYVQSYLIPQNMIKGNNDMVFSYLINPVFED